MKILCVLMLISLCACTNREIYNAIQNNQRNQCESMGVATEREKCLSRLESDYTSYERDRQELLKREPK